MQLDDRTASIQLLFSVGISDITRLEEHSHGWLACTTDDLLGEKKQLYDLLVELPTSETSIDGKAWPKLRTSDGKVIKASQRDLRRYRALQQEVARRRAGASDYRDDESAGDDDREEAPLFQNASRASDHDDGSANADTVEPETWTVAAYRSFMWWSSPREMEAWEAEEAAADQALLHDLDETPDSYDQHVDDSTRQARDVAKMLIAYFHRFTATFLRSLAGIVDEADDETDDADAIEISAEHMRTLGLDPWNENDKTFACEALRLYFDREAVVGEEGVWMCGVRIC